ncbi:MAG: sodium-dependent transporter, partial [Bacteroidales bacterium]|nr:sodium-dependent transporter [Bacteroidales bacterium]
LIYTFIFLALTSIILLAVVKCGIEKFSKIMMPVLFILIVLVAIRSLTLDGASKGLEYLFKPDWSKVTGQTVLAAMGQAFFSLSLGMGTLLTYGSYVSKDESIPKCAGLTASFDTLFALLAGVAIMPAVFSFGINPTEGPGLVFVALPEIFDSMPFGGFIAILFFISLFLAALTSSISLLEVVLAYFVEEHHIDRKKASVFLFITFLVTCGVCALSNGVWSNFKIFGFTVFDFFDYISANFLMTLGALFFVIFVGWVIGKNGLKDELENSGKQPMNKSLFNVLFFLIKYVLPVVIFIIFLSGILS